MSCPKVYEKKSRHSLTLAPNYLVRDHQICSVSKEAFDLAVKVWTF